MTIVKGRTYTTEKNTKTPINKIPAVAFKQSSDDMQITVKMNPTGQHLSSNLTCICTEHLNFAYAKTHWIKSVVCWFFSSPNVLALKLVKYRKIFHPHSFRCGVVYYMSKRWCLQKRNTVHDLAIQSRIKANLFIRLSGQMKLCACQMYTRAVGFPGRRWNLELINLWTSNS